MIDHFHMGILDNRTLNKSLGLLGPPPAVTASVDAPIKEILELLKEERFGCIMLVDDDDKLQGIFTERDVVLKLPLVDSDFGDIAVSEYMTRTPATAKMTTTIAFALNMMSHGGFRHIPIVDDDEMPVGIISVKNLVDYIANSLTQDLTRFERE
jgi:CBS domain-containing protein